MEMCAALCQHVADVRTFLVVWSRWRASVVMLGIFTIAERPLLSHLINKKIKH